MIKNAVNESKSKGELTSTMRFTIFKVLHKGDKDPKLASNFSPISQLSIIYKLVSCLIPNRIKKVIPQMISKKQKSYVPNVYIGYVLLNLLSSIKTYNEIEIASLILARDFYIAFDSISHLYIQNVLNNSSLGKTFVNGSNFSLKIG